MSNNKKQPLGYNEAFEHLRSMIGQEYIYRQKRIGIIEVSEIEHDRFMVFSTGLEPLKISLDKVEPFISECYPVESLVKERVKEVVIHEVREVSVPVQDFQLKSVNQAALVELGEGLMEQFRKIKNKPTKENLDAANSMIGISNTITNIAKLELTALALSKKIKT